MVEKQEIREILEGYDKDDIAIATVCSHSSLQIFDGARKEGFKTIGICMGAPPKFYDAFPKAKPDEFFVVKDYSEILSKSDELAKKNAILIPHGSFVEYLGTESFKELCLPTFGNRRVLEWESDREMSRRWLESAGIKMPRQIKNPEDIDSPMMVKYYGAKGGMGFFVVKNYSDFQKRINTKEKYTIQEQIGLFVEHKGQIFACGTCLKIRQMPRSEVCPISTMDDMLHIVEESDKVLVFG